MVDAKMVAHEGLGLAVRWYLVLFHANYGMVGSRYSERIQGAINVIIGLFRKHGLVVNVT